MRTIFLFLGLCLVACSNGGNSNGEKIAKPVSDTLTESSLNEDVSEEKELLELIRSNGAVPDKNATGKGFEQGWTNGHYWIFRDNDPTFEEEYELTDINLINFSGGDRHEGGYSFDGALINDSKVLIMNSMIPELEPGYSVSLHIQDSIPCLLVRSRNKKLKDVFVVANIPLANDVDIKAQEKLAGSYKERATGDIIEFIASSKTVKFGSEIFNFKFEIGEYDALADVISFGDKTLMFERTGNVLKLTNAKLIEEEYAIQWVPSGEPKYYDLIEGSDELTFKKFVEKLSLKE